MWVDGTWGQQNLLDGFKILALFCFSQAPCLWSLHHWSSKAATSVCPQEDRDLSLQGQLSGIPTMGVNHSRREESQQKETRPWYEGKHSHTISSVVGLIWVHFLNGPKAITGSSQLSVWSRVGSELCLLSDVVLKQVITWPGLILWLFFTVSFSESPQLTSESHGWEGHPISPIDFAGLRRSQIVIPTITRCLQP